MAQMRHRLGVRVGDEPSAPSAANIQNIFLNQVFMNKILAFLKESNRYKHLLGGFLVALGAFSPYAAIYVALVAASCLELKGKLQGGYWDWVDWSLTVLGGVLAAFFCWLL